MDAFPCHKCLYYWFVGYFRSLARSFLILFLVVMLSGNRDVYSQSVVPANTTYDDSFRQLYDAYTDEVGQGARIFTGHEYQTDDYLVGGSPFLIGRFETNPVVFDNILYDRISLMYDIYRQQLVINPPDSTGVFRKIALNKEKVNSFELDRKVFVRIPNDSVYTNHPGAGYFQVLYQGSVQVLARRNKKQRSSSGGTYQYEFYRSDDLFVLQNRQFAKIKSKKEARAVFGDAAKQLKSYAKSEGLQGEELENYFVYIARYNDRQLK